MSEKKTKTSGLTARDLELGAIAWQCFEGGVVPKLDFTKFALLAGLKNPQSASACWGPVKKKIMAVGNAAVSNKTASPSSSPAAARFTTVTATSNTSRKRKVPASDDMDVDDSEEEDTPKKKVKAEITTKTLPKASPKATPPKKTFSKKVVSKNLPHEIIDLDSGEEEEVDDQLRSEMDKLIDVAQAQAAAKAIKDEENADGYI